MLKHEALTKWCPFARVPGGAQFSSRAPVSVVAVNRVVEDGGTGLPPQVLCIADRCMAWRVMFRGDTAEDGIKRGRCGLAGEET